MDHKNTFGYKLGQLMGKIILVCLSAIIAVGCIGLTVKAVQTMLLWLF